MATKVKPSIDYTSKDYEAFRHDMINLIPYLMPEYTDFSESDAGVMLVELNAYVADILSYYQDRQANEVYLGTATQRKSVLDIVKQLGYRLSNAVPSSSKLVVELTEPLDRQFVIPKGFSVSTEGSEYEEPINFETTEDLVIPRGAKGIEQDEYGNYLYSVDIVQGITISSEVVGSSNGQPQQRFQLKYQDVIDDSVDLYVDEGAGLELWTDITNSDIGSTTDGKHYLRETDEDGFTYIVFGDGLNGKIPAIGTDNIYASYRIGGGADTNVGANSIIVANSNLAEIERVFNPIPATGGRDRESIESAKVNAPKLFKTQSRAVTTEDYANIARSVPGVSKAIAVPDDKLYNTVHVTIAPNGGGLPTGKLIQDVNELLDERKVITTNVIMEMPKYIYARISMNIQIEEEWSRQEVKTYVIEALKALFDFESREFGQGVPISKIYHDIMHVQGVYSVLITRTTINPLIEWGQVSGNPKFESVDSLPSLQYSGEWKVVMTSPTEFNVYRIEQDEEGNDIITEDMGSGRMDELFTANDNSIEFLIERGSLDCTVDDYWKFKTSPYLSDISVGDYEILLLDEADLEINIEGGRP